MKNIPEVELNCSNLCSSGHCYFCSRAHGSGNAPLMPEQVFEKLIHDLRGVEIGAWMTSGNGDCFLNPKFLHFLRRLRNTFPNAVIENYSNFLLYGPQISEIIIGDGLLDCQHVTIHSLDPELFRRATCLNPDIVLANLDCWIDRNRDIELTVHYASIRRYHVRCVETLGHWPMHSPFTAREIRAMSDEFEAINKRFSHGGSCGKIRFERTNFSLWAEREDPRTPRDIETPCPKLAVIEKTLWLSPSGTVQLCPYDDRQMDLTCGNILEETVWDIWTGERRRILLEKIRRREITCYPCWNPTACAMKP